jgi:hypothetical protein
MKKHLVALILFAMITSCAPVYIPNARNTPQFKGGGEFQANVQISQGVDVQAAASITDHIGVMANFANTNHTSVDDDQEDYIKHRFLKVESDTLKTPESFAMKFMVALAKGKEQPTIHTTFQHRANL